MRLMADAAGRADAHGGSGLVAVGEEIPTDRDNCRDDEALNRRESKGEEEGHHLFLDA
jgi:hypothetical protein